MVVVTKNLLCFFGGHHRNQAEELRSKPQRPSDVHAAFGSGTTLDLSREAPDGYPARLLGGSAALAKWIEMRLDASAQAIRRVCCNSVVEACSQFVSALCAPLVFGLLAFACKLLGANGTSHVFVDGGASRRIG